MRATRNHNVFFVATSAGSIPRLRPNALDDQFEACCFGKSPEVSVSREQRNSIIDAALRDQCVA